jgi:hypothetical protein
VFVIVVVLVASCAGRGRLAVCGVCPRLRRDRAGEGHGEGSGLRLQPLAHGVFRDGRGGAHAVLGGCEMALGALAAAAFVAALGHRRL